MSRFHKTKDAAVVGLAYAAFAGMWLIALLPRKTARRIYQAQLAWLRKRAAR